MQHKRGFTLIELLSAIAIIAILAAILVPVFQKVRENTYRNNCASNLSQLGLAISYYTQDNDRTFPIAFGYWDGQAPTWTTGILPYVTTISVFQCPQDSLAGANADNTWEGIPISYAANADHEWGSKVGRVTFRGIFAPMNANGTWDRATAAITGPCIDASDTPRTVGAVNRPADTIMLAEVLNQDGILPGSSGANMSVWDTNSITNYFIGQNIPDSTSTSAYPSGVNGVVSVPHGDNTLANFLFADGHFQALPPAATHTPTVNMWDATRP